MKPTRAVKLHSDRVIWPEYRPYEHVLELKATTAPITWETTYQGSALPQGGNVFHAGWFNGRSRYHFGSNRPIARYISLDTASSESEDAAYTAWTVGDLLPDYRLAIVEMGKKRLEFPELVNLVQGLYNVHYLNGLLRNIVIEDKSSGISLLQTLKKASEVSRVLTGYNPKVDKPTRWNQAAVWCSLGCVLLPHPSDAVPWLLEAEDDLFYAQQADTMDAFSALIIYLENFISQGHNARKGNVQ